jgi:type IV pilus assembly protein PilB
MQSFVVPGEFTEKRVDLEQLTLLNPEFCFQRKILPLRVFRGSTRSFLVLAAANLKDSDTVEIVNRKTGLIAVPFFAESSAIVSFLRDRVSPDLLPQDAAEHGIQLSIRKMITDAIKKHASDIHIETGESEVSIRHRIDGVLYPAKRMEKNEQNVFVTEIKKMAKMDLSNSQFPQSSRLVLTWDDQKYQLNVLTFPTPYGENVTIKIVNLAAFQRGLHELGLDEYDYTRMLLALDSSFGLIVVSGPAMNGCSTTQYAMLRYLAASNRKVMTLESPIFTMIKNIHQTEINPAAGYDYVSVLNSIIRSDPDVIFLSDVPNAEVATTLCKIASRCVVVVALTADSAADAIVFLRELAASPSMLSHSLSLVVNQRLIRKICAHCSRKSAVSESMLNKMGFRAGEMPRLESYSGAGCEECNYLGFQGRTAIFEVLTVNQRVSELTAAGAAAKEMERTAVQMGMISLRSRCLQKVGQGLTTIEEFEKCKFDS